MKLLKTIFKSDFIKSSSFIFIINNLINVMNYVLLILVIIILKDVYGLWISAAALFALLSVPLSGFGSIFSREVSLIAEKSKEEALNFYSELTKKLKSSILVGIGICVLATVLIQLVLKFEIWAISIVFTASLILTLVSSLSLNFLSGLLEIKKFGQINFIGNITRLISTAIFLYAGLQLIALPLGIILGSIATYLMSKKAISEIFQNSNTGYIKTYENYKIANFINITTLKHVFYLILISFILNIDTIFSRTFLSTDENNKYGIISTFGQIAHYGPISFTSLIIPFAARKNHRQIYILSVISIVFFSLGVLFIYTFFSQSILGLLQKSNHTQLVPNIQLYTVYVLFINLIYISANYLVSRKSIKYLRLLFALVTAQIASIFFIATNSQIQDKITTIILTCTILIFCGAVAIVSGLWESSKEPDNS